MSDADHRTGGIVAEGVTVEKAVRTDDFEVPSVVLSIRGPPGRAAVVRVLDPLPDGLDAGEIGFHPKHGGEYWTFEGDHVAFERRFDPGEEYRTVYGVAVDPEEDDWSTTEPDVEVVDVDELGAPGTSGRTTAEASDWDGSTPGQPDEGGTNVLVKLAEELEGGDPADVERVREALDAGTGRSDVADLDDRLFQLSTDLEALGDRVAALEERDEPGADEPGHGPRLDELETTLETLRDDLDALSTAVDEATDRNARDIDDLGAELREPTRETASGGSAGDRLDDLERSVESMQDDLETVLDFTGRLQSTLRAFESESE